MEGSNVLRGVFFTLMCAIIMALLYEIFFKVPMEPNGVHVEGVIQYSALKIEHPISKYYYSYCFLPYAHMEDSTDLSLGVSLKSYSGTNFDKMESNLTSDSSDNILNYGVSTKYYSTGWQ